METILSVMTYVGGYFLYFLVSLTVSYFADLIVLYLWKYQLKPAALWLIILLPVTAPIVVLLVWVKFLNGTLPADSGNTIKEIEP